MRRTALNAAWHEDGGRVTANFVPWENMTVEQKREHLMDAHAFNEYEERDGEPYYLRTADEDSLDVVHKEDHAERQMGGSIVCQHAHGKVTV